MHPLELVLPAVVAVQLVLAVMVHFELGAEISDIEEPVPTTMGPVLLIPPA